jgi:hypothetical protein
LKQAKRGNDVLTAQIALDAGWDSSPLACAWSAEGCFLSNHAKSFIACKLKFVGTDGIGCVAVYRESGQTAVII